MGDDELGTAGGVGRTYDADLEVVSWPSEEGLLLRGGGLLGRHGFLFLCGECAGDVEGPAAIERCESRGGEGRTRGRTERASSEDEQPSESISLHRISRKPPKNDTAGKYHFWPESQFGESSFR